MTPPRWIVPLGPGPLDHAAAEVTVNDELAVDIRTIDMEGRWIDVDLSGLPSLVACQLGQALQDASAWCGRERAKREARKGLKR